MFVRVNTEPVFFSSKMTRTMTKMTKTFWVIVDDTKTETKIKTRDENETEINGILVLTTLTRISEAKFNTMLASVWQNNEGIYAHKSALLSPHADRHAGHILVTVCFLFVCPQDFGNVVTDISGTGWCRAMKFCRMVDLAVCQVISPFGELWPRS